MQSYGCFAWAQLGLSKPCSKVAGIVAPVWYSTALTHISSGTTAPAIGIIGLLPFMCTQVMQSVYAERCIGCMSLEPASHARS